MSTQDPHFDPPTIMMPQAVASVEPGAVRAYGGLPPGMPATVAFAGERALFEQRLTAVLAGAVQGLQYDVADFYLLDDHSAELRCIASTGARRPAPRCIQGAAGDLIAMAGDAVVLENFELMHEIGAPRNYGAAVCVPVASDTTIHGSLWVYSEKPRVVSNAEVQLIEIVAGRLAVEVERRELLENTNPLAKSPVRVAGLPLPTVELEFDELEVAGQVESPLALYDWHVLGDGRVLTYAASYVDGPGLAEEDGALALQATRIALRCHAEGSRDAGQLLNRAARVIAESEGAPSGVSLAAAILDPESGEGSYALAGAAAAIRVRASWQAAEVTDDPPLGWDGSQKHRTVGFELKIRERLLLTVGSPRDLTLKAARGIAKRFGTVSADTHRRMSAKRALDKLYEAASVQLDTAIVVRRR